VFILCARALDINAATQIEEARKKTDDIMDILMEDREFREMLMKKPREHDFLQRG